MTNPIPDTQTIAMPSMVIFDMDGTSVRHLNPYVIEIIEFLDDLSYKIFRLFNWRIKLRRGKPPLRSSSKRRPFSPKILAHRAIHMMRRKPVERIVEPCPNIIDVLESLQAKKIPVGLVSNGLGRGYGHDILRKFGLEPYFQDTIFAEDINRTKPDPDPILKMTQLLKQDIGADDVVWYIGDRRKDVIAALNARDHLPCRIIPFAYGYLGSAFFTILEQGLSTDHIIGSYAEMLQKLEALFGETDK